VSKFNTGSLLLHGILPIINNHDDVIYSTRSIHQAEILVSVVVAASVVSITFHSVVLVVWLMLLKHCSLATPTWLFIYI